MPRLEGFSPKQSAFIDYYLETLNASDAARRAGYSPKTAGKQAEQYLKKPKIKAEIQKRLASKRGERVASVDEILEFLTAAMRDNSNSIKDRIKAGELLGKRYAIFTEKIHRSGKVEIIIDIETEVKDSGEINGD